MGCLVRALSTKVTVAKLKPETVHSQRPNLKEGNTRVRQAESLKGKVSSESMGSVKDCLFFKTSGPATEIMAWVSLKSTSTLKPGLEKTAPEMCSFFFFSFSLVEDKNVLLISPYFAKLIGYRFQ